MTMMHDHHPGVGGAAQFMPLLLLAAVLATYVAAAMRQRRAGRGWSGWRTAGFAAGVVLVGVAVSPPLAAWAHHDMRGHMTQHLLTGMFAPLGLVLAAPLTLALRTLPVPTARALVVLLRSRLVHGLGHPVTALVLNIGGMYLLYLTPLYAATLDRPLLHHLVHVHFLAAGCLFVWAIASPDPAPHRPGLPLRLAVLFLAMAAHATLGKLMYAHLWPRGTLHSAEEIRAAAKLMYYGGDAAELLLAIALFAAWYHHRGRDRKGAGEVANEAAAARPTSAT